MEHRRAARATFPGQEFNEHLVQLRLVETAIDLAVVRDADQARLLADDEHDRVALHRESESRAMTRPHPADTGQRLRKWEHATGSNDAALADDHRPVMQR